MPDYSKGKIYTIRCRSNPEYIYVGSTIQSLAVRWGGHKKDSKKDVNRLIYSTINNDWDNWYIELYVEYPCDNREQLCKREGEIIREIGTLNKNITGREKKQYYIDNKEKIQQYKIDNKEKINKQNREYNKQYSIDNAEKIQQYRIDNAEKIKQYRIDNKEKIKKQKREYHQRKKLESN